MDLAFYESVLEIDSRYKVYSVVGVLSLSLQYILPMVEKSLEEVSSFGDHLHSFSIDNMKEKLDAELLLLALQRTLKLEDEPAKKMWWHSKFGLWN
ncbi:hypothetical protein V6N13_043469 [Hibiscus sabdariffa]